MDLFMKPIGLVVESLAKRLMVQGLMGREYMKLKKAVLELPEMNFMMIWTLIIDLFIIISDNLQIPLLTFNICTGGKIHWWVGHPQGTHMPMLVRQDSVLTVKKLLKHLLRNMVGNTWYVPLQSIVSLNHCADKLYLNLTVLGYFFNLILTLWTYG